MRRGVVEEDCFGRFLVGPMRAGVDENRRDEGLAAADARASEATLSWAGGGGGGGRPPERPRTELQVQEFATGMPKLVTLAFSARSRSIRPCTKNSAALYDERTSGPDAT